MNHKKEIKKPLPCNQKWDDMLPASNGRICLGCGKLVSDFRTYSWNDIAKVHNSSPIPVCGIYSEEQLNSWGKEVSSHQSSCSKLMAISAALLALTQLSLTTAQSQTTVKQQQIQTGKQSVQNKPTIKKPTSKFISGTIVVLQPDSSKNPLEDVSVFVLQDSLHLKTTTDSVGRFVIDITKRIGKLPKIFTLILSHPDFPNKSITINKNNLKTLDITLHQVSIVGNQIPLETRISVSYFYAAPPAKINTVDKQSKLKKNWWPWKRKTK